MWELNWLAIMLYVIGMVPSYYFFLDALKAVEADKVFPTIIMISAVLLWPIFVVLGVMLVILN